MNDPIPTPRTDSLIKDIKRDPGLAGCIPKEFCRSLERENAKLRDALEIYDSWARRVLVPSYTQRRPIPGTLLLAMEKAQAVLFTRTKS